MSRERVRAICRSTVLFLGLAAVGVGAAGGVSSIKSLELREWLTYIASDELQGRAVYSTGLGLAAAFIGDHLKTWGLKPGGDHAGYLQRAERLTQRETFVVRRSVIPQSFGVLEPRTSNDEPPTILLT